MEQGDLESALSTYMEALEHSPDNPELLTTLGITFLRCACAAQAACLGLTTWKLAFTAGTNCSCGNWCHDAAGFACARLVQMCAVLCGVAGLVTTSGRLTTWAPPCFTTPGTRAHC